jgi:glycosyltransferase involved in cell wall biosynthesis
VIFIVQNVRHANPSFTGGYALRLLTRPMARIMTNDVVLEAVRPYLNTTSMTEVILLGNESDFFARERRAGLGDPVRVGYTTWKSRVGDEVARKLAENPGFRFRAIREPVGWQELRDLYQWSDIFLATPLAEEGFYMPGLEAMAAGAIVVSPDAGGNRAYCRFGENCIGVGLDEVADYVGALKELRVWPADKVERLRTSAYEAVGRHTLKHERERFGEFIEKLTTRLDRLGPRV